MITNETKRGRGRPEFAPTPEQRRLVKALAAVGVSQVDIATVVDIDVKTLRKHFRTELDVGAIEANAKVAQALFKRATEEKGSAGVQAAIFWLKVRAGWRETDQPSPTSNLGKKATQEMLARTSHHGTDWETLLN